MPLDFLILQRYKMVFVMGEVIGHAIEHPLVAKAGQKLASFPLQEIHGAGIQRDRRFYFLNISYPSMQAMDRVDSLVVYPASFLNNGSKKRHLDKAFPIGTC